jgi:CHAD domain-containing protein
MKAIGISPADTLAAAGRKVWLFNFALMLCHEEGTLQGLNNEELHDMRVATRRMRTAFDVFGPAFEPRIMKRFLKGLRSIGRVLGEVRDMDVILEHGLSYQAKMDSENRPDLQPLISAWKHSVDKKRSKMTGHLTSDEYHSFKENFNLFLQAPEHTRSAVENKVMNPQLRDIVPVLIYGRYAAVRAYETSVPTASVAQLHTLRIEFKKFRYVLEYFREILGENISTAINEIKHIQDHLGVLHDTDVACQLVSDFLVDWDQDQLHRPIFERRNPEPIVTYLAFLHAERYRLTSTFPELWVKFSRPEFRQGIAQAVSIL